MAASAAATRTLSRHETAAPRLPETCHAVAPVDLPHVVPAPLAGVAEPMIDRIRPGDLLVDDTYQRGLTPRSMKLIRRIVEQWDWLRFKAPIVALTDRGFEVVDGQHTAIAAACHPDIETIPVLVVDGSDLKRRARAFVSHAVDRLKATPVQIWHAAVAAGDEDAVTVRNVLERAGVTMLLRPATDGAYATRETVAVGAVRRLVDKRGAMRAREVMELVAAAELAPITADHVRITEALLLDPEYAGGLDGQCITAALRGITPKQVAEAAELAVAKRLPTWRALTAVLYRAQRTPKRGRTKATEAAEPTMSQPAIGSEGAPVTERATKASGAGRSTSTGTNPVAPVEPAAPQAAGPGAVPVAELIAGIDRWRRGEAWRPSWGPAPGDPACAVPAALLGPEVVIVGRRLREAVVDHVAALWRRDRTWPTSGWGPPPSGPDCAVPLRFLRPEFA